MNKPQNPNSLFPRFIFIAGSNTPDKLELARLIADRDTSILVEDLMRLPQEATRALFYHNDILNDDPTKLDTKLPIRNGNITVGDWLRSFEHCLTGIFGDSALAHIALNDYIAAGWHDVFERTIYRDAYNTDHVQPFATRFGPERCLVLDLSALRRGWCCRAIFVGGLRNPQEQLKFIDSELALP